MEVGVRRMLDVCDFQYSPPRSHSTRIVVDPLKVPTARALLKHTLGVTITKVKVIELSLRQVASTAAEEMLA